MKLDTHMGIELQIFRVSEDRSKDSHVLNVRLIIHQVMYSMIRVPVHLLLNYEVDHRVGLVATRSRNLG